MYPSLNMFTFASPTATWRRRCSSATTTGCSTTARPRRSASSASAAYRSPTSRSRWRRCSGPPPGACGASPSPPTSAGPALQPPRLRPLLGRRPGLRCAAHHAHLHRRVARRRPARALGHAGWHDQGLHAGPHRPRSNTMIDLICGGVVRALPRAPLRASRVRDRLGGPLPPAPRPRHLPHAEYAVDYLTMKPSDVLPPQLLGDLRGRRGRGAHPRPDRRRPPAVGQRLPPPRRHLAALDEILTTVFADVPEGEQEQIVWSNTVDLYGIDTTSSPPPPDRPETSHRRVRHVPRAELPRTAPPVAVGNRLNQGHDIGGIGGVCGTSQTARGRAPCRVGGHRASEGDREVLPLVGVRPVVEQVGDAPDDRSELVVSERPDEDAAR